MIIASISAQSSVVPEIPKMDRLKYWFDPTDPQGYEVDNNRLVNKVIGDSYLVNGDGGSEPAYMNGATVVYGPDQQSNEFVFQPNFNYSDPSRNWTVVIFQRYLGGAGNFFYQPSPQTRLGLTEDKEYYVRIDGNLLDAGEQGEGKFHMFTVTKSGTNFKSLVNKVLRLNTNNGAGGPRNPVIFPNGEAVEAWFGPVLIYDQSLTEGEIKSIYDYYKKRYQLA